MFCVPSISAFNRYCNRLGSILYSPNKYKQTTTRMPYGHEDSDMSPPRLYRQVLQLSSSFSPRRQRFVWVAPQFEHSGDTVCSCCEAPSGKVGLRKGGMLVFVCLALQYLLSAQAVIHGTENQWSRRRDRRALAVHASEQSPVSMRISSRGSSMVGRMMSKESKVGSGWRTSSP